MHVSEDFAPYGRRRDERVRSALGDVPLVATGSPYLVSPGRVTKDDGDAVQGVHAVLQPMAEHGLAGGGAIRRQVGALGRSRAVGQARQTGRDTRPRRRTRPGRRRGGRAAAVERVRRQRTRPLRRRPQSAGPRRHQPDVSASEVRHHPPADDGRRLGPASCRRAGVLAGVGIPRLLCRGAASLAATAPGGTGTATSTPSKIDTGAEAKRRFEAWKAGETGFPIVDAGMRQLRETGYMHNRVRMIVASFLVKDLHLPWQWGARWFLDQLVDGDMANNQHGWQWCAGCGTDAAPYFRVFNPDHAGREVRSRQAITSAAGCLSSPTSTMSALTKGERPAELSRADRRPQRGTQRSAAPLPTDQLSGRQRAAFLRSMSASAAASSARWAAEVSQAS